MHETEFTRKYIRPYLETKYKARVFKVHGNAFTEAGTPDLLCSVQGLFAGLEVKMEGNTPTPVQLRVLESIRKSGGIAGVVYSHTYKEDIDQLLSIGIP